MAPRAIVVPHGTYDRSGAVAAAAWARVPSAQHVARTVVLGPSHHTPFRGVAAPFADAIETPLGELAVDRIAVEALRAVPDFVVNDAPHDQECSIDAQLPFLQRMFAESAVIPLIVGDRSEHEAAAAIDLLRRDETFVVVSSDLSRYHDASHARRLDEATANAIESLDADGIGEEQACGLSALRALLLVARRAGWKPTRIELRQSGSPDEVVGYGAFVFA